MAQHDESQDEPVNDADLADHVRRANAVPIRSEDVDAALRLVVAMALASVEGADGASVTLLRRGELRTVASSDETTTDLDGDQYALDSGPCVEASRYGQPVFAGSFDSNEQRWPDFVERARARGIAAMLSMPLVVDEVSIGAINVNSRVAGGLSTSSLAAAANVADEARIFLAAAGSDILDDRFRRRIQQALEERDLAAKALGVVMAREQIDEDAAFTVLRQLAASRDQSFREVTETVVASARPTEPVESERAP